MATLSFSSLSLYSFPFSSPSTSSPSPSPSPSLAFKFDPQSSILKLVSLKKSRVNSKNLRLRSIVKAVQDITEQQSSTSEQTPAVVVPVSPSDTLTMFFQADGTLNETAIPAVTKALEETDGVANLKVRVVEGLASVELKKQTTVQATGVASSLLETIQGSGFKLQTLHLSFDDEEDATA